MSARPVPAPSIAAVRLAFAREGTNLRAAEVLGINYRTLERRMAEDPQLRAAADAGRRLHKAAKPLPPHGTVARYERERAAGNGTCAKCKAENARYHRQLAASRRGVAA